MVNNLEQKIVLSQLPVAEGACFGSHIEDHELTCLPNTRVDLLQDWVKNPEGARVFWLNGMAGTGKSTISRTVAQRLDDDKMLGASFFFKTGEAERSTLSRFFSTIAADMVIKVPEVSTAVKEALHEDADFRKRVPGQQPKNLVIEPLMRSQGHRPDHPIVLIVDALDERKRDQEIYLLINLFTDFSPMKMSQLKIFITSRPEIPNRRAFGKATAGSYHPVILHELPEP
uniref:Nephrocystin 3-like N-terminal domain-containing protein n=1 Tax=Bionectria ochroleuca TaxID=29856 RepID=A0A0B7KKF2_BIOOC